MRLPRILLCAPASGSGKTTVTCALLQALTDRGARPASFKCGPDYIDPMFHSRIIGAPAHNLDLFFLGREGCRRLLARGGRDRGVAVVEGVMGYYDGVAMSSDASAWDLARATDTPAVLVADGRGCARSLAALVKGFLTLEEDSRIRGVILNQVSPMLYPRLKETVEQETGVRVYGFLPRLADCALESRHLGLVTADEVAGLRAKTARLARQAEETVDLDGLLELAASAPELEDPGPPPAPAAGRPRIAVARDRAFCFYYADALELLEELGAELAEFSPLEDRALPEGASGLYLGGGYPELYAQRLSENREMLRSVREAVSGGMPTVAECGGFLYLHDTLEGEDGVSRPMAGVIPAHGFRTSRLGRFGYVTLRAETGGLLLEAGEELPAHEFHYWDSRRPGEAFLARKPRSDRRWSCGWHSASLYAGFPHFHLWARPEAARRWVEACAAYQTKQ